jgi:uncharacterized membrane protein YdbT with pleckstrin-like domain
MILDSLLHPQSEKRVLTLRRHWIVPAQIMVAALVLIVALFSLWFFFADFMSQLTDSNAGRAFLIISHSIYIFSVLLFIAYAFIDYWLDVWIVTTSRILFIEQKGLFHRVISELELIRVQDITSSTKGAFATLFRYGAISVQTASEIPRFIFRYLPNPDLVREQIMKLLQDARK